MTVCKKCSKIVIYWSMTVSHYSWVIAENCHWPVNDSFALQLGNRRKLSLTSQWQFLGSLQNYHWLVNDSFALQLGNRRKLSLTSQWQYGRSVQKLSLTGQWQFRITVGLSQKIVIDQSMTIWKKCSKIVIDQSMTILRLPSRLSLTSQWQFCITVG